MDERLLRVMRRSKRTLGGIVSTVLRALALGAVFGVVSVALRRGLTGTARQCDDPVGRNQVLEVTQGKGGIG